MPEKNMGIHLCQKCESYYTQMLHCSEGAQGKEIFEWIFIVKR